MQALKVNGEIKHKSQKISLQILLKFLFFTRQQYMWHPSLRRTLVRFVHYAAKKQQIAATYFYNYIWRHFILKIK